MVPTVTLSKAASQSDPTNEFSSQLLGGVSETVTGFSASGVQFNGACSGCVATVAAVGSSTTNYSINVTGMENPGVTTVNVTVVAGAARDTASNNNTASAAVAVVYGKLVVGCVHGMKKKDAAGCSS